MVLGQPGSTLVSLGQIVKLNIVWIKKDPSQISVLRRGQCPRKLAILYFANTKVRFEHKIAVAAGPGHSCLDLREKEKR